MKYLLAFDFDHTIVDDNTDTFIFKLGENGDIPSRIKDSRQRGQWTAYMNSIFHYLHTDCRVTKEEYEKMLRMIPLTPSMDEIFRLMRQHQSIIDFIIVSDSNAVFIDAILSHYSAKDLPIEVFTNEAIFKEDGMLQISPYHIHNHESCPFNLCKGKVMQEFIDKRQRVGVSYDQIIYVGDGNNDYCPSTFLSDTDILFARKDYGLHRKLLKQENNGLKCKVEIWETGSDVFTALKNILESQ